MVELMKKYFIILGAFFIVSLLISTTTAVPKVQSDSVLDFISEAKEKNNIIDFKNLKNQILNIQSGGIIDLLIQLITLIIQFVLEIIGVIQNIIGLVNLVQNLIDAFTTLFQLIQDLIDLINEIFNPTATFI